MEKWYIHNRAYSLLFQSGTMGILQFRFVMHKSAQRGSSVDHQNLLGASGGLLSFIDTVDAWSLECFERTYLVVSLSHCPGKVPTKLTLQKVE